MVVLEREGAEGEGEIGVDWSEGLRGCVLTLTRK
jgi:hypothetical protein